MIQKKKVEEEIDETESNIPDDMKKILQRCEFNWFHFMDSIPVQEQQKMYFVSSVLMLESFEKCCLNEQDKCLLKQSYLAFCSAKEDAYDQDRTARIVNREIVSESESDSPETYANTTDPLSATRKELIAKKRPAIRRRARRKQEKAISEQSFLSRKASKRATTLLQTFPDIGETIDTFIQDHQVGADAWRRTDVLTFDGNVNLKEKVTFDEKICQHLQDTYQPKFSYGSVIQLCIPRNRRRTSAKRYKCCNGDK